MTPDAHNAATRNRPQVILSVAVSLDGYIDDAARERLLLSSPEDFDRVDSVRAECDAILIGANTLRRDNPRLLIASEHRRALRAARGLPVHPLKVVLSASGDLDPAVRFWHCGDEKVIYTCAASDGVSERFDGIADVVEAGTPLDLGAVLDDLWHRGVRRLMVEGGGTVHTQFLAQDLADELHIAVAPVLVGQRDAPRFLHPARFPGGTGRRLRLIDTQPLGDTVLNRYDLRGSAA
ncbi:MAG TPA: dihydrofolate reductase family protein [Streptomyces sp.]|nr:dihydrofolate reductase family protein [Streptomyces sp.]